jgi:uncharacterized surface protein with fasciclin (FAS1) repeats
MRIKILTIVVLFTLAFVSCKNDQKEVKSETKTEVTTKPVSGHKGQASVKAGEDEQANALQVAKSLPDFTTLVAAIEAAGVQDAVVNAGPLTIFAPVNGAFDKLPEGTVETLLKPENKTKLAYILVNHVAPANYPIKQLKKEAKKGRKLYMASGKYLVVENKGGKIFVGGTEILKSVKVSNGWIHVVGDVLVPAE